MGKLKKVRFRSTEDARWEEIWRIYQSSFPFYEIRSERLHGMVFGEDDYYCQAFYEEDTLVGIAFYWEIPWARYVEYLAISQGMRGKGYGSQIMKEVCDTDKIILLEIDPPIDEISTKRRRFYERLGFHMNDFRYIHPSFYRKKHPHELKIMSRPRKMTDSEYQTYLKYLDQMVLKHAEWRE